MRLHSRRNRLAVGGLALLVLTLTTASVLIFVFRDFRSAATGGGSGLLMCALIVRAVRSQPAEGPPTAGDHALSVE